MNKNQETLGKRGVGQEFLNKSQNFMLTQASQQTSKRGHYSPLGHSTSRTWNSSLSSEIFSDTPNQD